MKDEKMGERRDRWMEFVPSSLQTASTANFLNDFGKSISGITAFLAEI